MVIESSSKLLSKYLDIEDYPTPARHLIKQYFGLQGLITATFHLSSAFYILFVLDRISFREYGIILSLTLIFQALVDFPTAVIADWLGRKFVLTLSYFIHSVSFMLLAFSVLVPDEVIFPYLFLVYSIESFAIAQESGSLQAWFDSNYRQIVDDIDSSRERYRLIFGKTMILIRFMGSFAVLFGGRISDRISRQGVFIIQAGFYFALALIILFLFQEKFTIIEVPRSSLKSYLGLLFSGAGLIFKSRLLLFFISAYVLMMMTNAIWIAFIFIPLNYAFTGSDPLAALLYFTIFFSGSVMTFVGVHTSKQIRISKWLPLVVLLYSGLYYGVYALIILAFPVDLDNPSLNITAALTVFVISLIGTLLHTIWVVSAQRIMIDLIPNENRNAFYSIIPTLSLIITSIVAFSIGRMIAATSSLFLPIFFFLVIPTAGAGIALFIALYHYEFDDQLQDPILNYLGGTDAIGGHVDPSLSLLNIPKNWKIHEFAHLSWHELMNTATMDGPVTDEEKRLLRQIIVDIRAYGSLLEDALVDDLIDAEEKRGLLVARSALMKNAEIIALKDERISSDEQKIIDKLHEILQNFETFETMPKKDISAKTPKKGLIRIDEEEVKESIDTLQEIPLEEEATPSSPKLPVKKAKKQKTEKLTGKKKPHKKSAKKKKKKKKVTKKAKKRQATRKKRSKK